MKKLKLQVQVSIDGYMCGTEGEMDWLVFDWSQDLKDFVTELTRSSEKILLGRKLAEGFIPYWAQSYASNEPAEGAEYFALMPKVVFSRGKQSHAWENTELKNGFLKEEVEKLKSEKGKDLITYGGVDFISSLLNEDLIDDLYLFINPVILGKGRSPFEVSTQKKNLSLMSARQFDCGICVLHYKKDKA